jgi:tRNA pseudouridine55 synthase
MLNAEVKEEFSRVKDGVLVIDKPSGPTSHDVVAAVRRATRIERIGHTGTLDPLATGVLPLVVGRATRLASFLSGAEKEYVAQVRFGASTATYDAEGTEEKPDRTPPDLLEEDVTSALGKFVGTYLQMPPPFSAKKVGGTPAYKLARLRKPVELKPIEVTVRELELRSYSEGCAELRLVCLSGFYVRSLAHDLGQQLGVGGHLEGLRRTRAGDFTIADATPLVTIVTEGPSGIARLIPIDRLLTELPAVILTERGARRASHGNTLSPEDFSAAPAIGRGTDEPRSAPRIRLVDGAGALVGIGEPRAGGLLHPAVVLV